MAIEIDYSEVTGKKVECPPQCGMCCLCQPEVLPEERAYFRTKHPKELVKNGNDFSLAMKKGKGSCVFLNGRRCDIYQNRTTFCRQFPFHFHVSDRIRVELDLSCRGVWTEGGEDAVKEAKALAESSEKRLAASLKEASAVYREFYAICKETGVMQDPSMLRMSVSENVMKFTELGYIAKVMNMSLEEPDMTLNGVMPETKFDLKEMQEAAKEAALESLGSEDPMSVPIYCDKNWNWNMFLANGSTVEWTVMDDEGEMHHKGFADANEIELKEPDEEGKKVLADYINVLNGRDSFLGNVFYNMDQLGYEDDMSNSYYGSLCATILDLLWRASLLDHFFGTGMGAEGIREAIIFYDMDRLDAPTIGAIA